MNAAARSNPSGWAHRAPLVILALVGVAIATWLTLYQIGATDTLWGLPGDRSPVVLTSGVARATGLPDASLGVFAYALEALLGLVGGTDRWHTRPTLVLAYGFVVVAFGFVSLLLVALQLFVFRAFCTLCLASAILSLALVIPGTREARAVLRQLRGTHPFGRARRRER